MRRRLNVKVLIGLIAIVVVLGLGSYTLHGFQTQRTADTLLTRAEDAEAEGDFDEAEKLLSRYLGYKPTDVEGLVKLGTLVADQAETEPGRDRAIGILERALFRDSELRDVRRRVVEIMMTSEPPRFEDAKGHLERLLRSSAEDAELHLLLGRCEEDAGNFREAVEHYETAKSLEPGRVDAYARLAELLRTRLSNPDRADRVMNAREVEDGGLIAENGKSAPAYLARAQYRRRYEIAGADGDIARALELAPDNPDVILAAATLASDQGEFEAALTHLKRGVEQAPDEPQIYELASRVELQADRPEEALAWLERGLEQLPDEVNLRFSLAEMLIRLGRWDRTEATISTLEEQGLRPELGQYLKGRVAMGRQRWGRAVEFFEDARLTLETQPEAQRLTKRTLLLLGRCYEQLGDQRRRYEAYRRATSIDLDPDPLWAAARLGMADALVDRNQIDEAIQQYRLVRSRSSNPQVPIVLARLLTLQNLSRQPDRRDWREVEQLLDAAAEAAPDDINIPILRAEVLVAQDKFDEARELLEEAREAHPDSVRPWLSLASLAEQQESPEEALAILEAAQRELGDRAALRVGRIEYWSRREGNQATEALTELGRNIEELPTEDQEPVLRALAAAYSRLDEPERALSVWEELAKQRPNDLGVQSSRFDLALRAGDGAIAEQALDRIRGIGGPDSTLGLYGEALLLIWQAKQSPAEHRQPLLDQAHDRLLRVSAQRPNWSPAVLALAEVAILRGDEAGAMRSYLSAVEDLGDQSPSTLVSAALLLYRNDRYEQADRMIDLIHEQNIPISSDLQRLVADIAFRAQDYGQALEQAQAIVSEESDDYRDLLWLGRLQWAAGQDAEPMLRRAVELASDAPDTWMALVGYLAATDQDDEAEAVLREAERQLPEDQVTRTLARGFELLGQREQAAELYEEALAARPDDINILKDAAAFVLRYGQPQKAEQYLQRIVDRHSGTSEAEQARRVLTLLTAAGGGYREALNALESLDQVTVGANADPDDLRTKAKVLAMQPNRALRQQAIDLMNEVIEREPPRADDLFLLAQLYDANGNWAEARRQIEELLNTFGQEPDYLAYLVRGLLRQGNVAEAKVYLRELEQVASDQPVTIEIQARVLAASNAGDEAIALLETFTENNPARLVPSAQLLEELDLNEAAKAFYRDFADRYQSERPEAILPLARFLGRQGRTKEALDLLLDEKVWEAVPPELVSNVSVLALYEAKSNTSQYQRVLQQLEQAIQEHPEKISIQFDLANVRTLQGKYDEAASIYEAIHEQNPDVGGPLNNLAWMLALRGEGDKALPFIRDAIELEGETPDLLDTRALVHLANGRADLAIRDLEDAISVQTNNADMYFHLAQAYQMADRPDEAKATFQQAQTMGLTIDDLHPLERESYDRLVGVLQGKGVSDLESAE